MEQAKVPQTFYLKNLAELLSILLLNILGKMHKTSTRTGKMKKGKKEKKRRPEDKEAAIGKINTNSNFTDCKNKQGERK